MKELNIKLLERCGAFCADGQKAAHLRKAEIDPVIQSVDRIILDFKGVRNMNSSFANALIVNLFKNNDISQINKFHFRNCNSNIKTLIEIAFEIGINKFDNEAYA